MYQYQYQHGDKPLAGYTIERAAGRGGFGEVYYAVSDSGRQVAIKTVQNYEQIELRGIKQCMNLKNPHLVTIFDVKYNDKGRPFVIMEFVSGMSLRDLLDEHPQGIGTQKAAFFLQEIAKGLSYLHDCGIVHRDLKPGNIFYENGIVKIGDYGLTKSINHTQHSAQTITVGTVHYMAPEIGEGKYNFSIDIYALGILLYEMITGQVPFFGSSPGEILMKHMAHEPDLTGIDPTLAKVIKKALAKDPAQRYPSVKEMVEDVFGTEHIRQSVSQFAPESLSIIAERVSQKARTSPTTASPPPPPPPHIDPPGASETSSMGQRGEKIGRRLGEAAEQFGRKVSQAAVQLDEHLKARNTGNDPVSRKQRGLLTIITVGIIALTGGALTANNSGGGGEAIPGLFLCIYGTMFGIMWGRYRALRNMEPSGTRRFLTGALGIALGTILTLPTQALRIGGFEGSLLLFGLYVLLTDWWKLSAVDRKERIDWGPIIWGGIVGFILAGVFDGNSIIAATMIAGTLLAVQVASPFGAPVNSNAQPAIPFGSRAKDRWSTLASRWQERSRHNQRHQDVMAQEAEATVSEQEAATATLLRHPNPAWLRALFMVGCILFLGIGLFLLIMAGATRMGNDDFTIAVAFGIDSLLASFFCLIRACRSQRISWYRYLIKPLVKLILLATVIFSSVCLGNMQLADDETAIAIFFIVFPALLYLVVCFFPTRLVEEMTGARPVRSKPNSIPKASPQGSVSRQNHFVALLLALPIWFPAGMHRIYVGKIGTGILWFLTGGLGGIGQFIDIILILAGRFKDVEGRPLCSDTYRSWRDSRNANRTDTVTPSASSEVMAPASPSVPSPDSKEPVIAPPVPPATETPRSSSGAYRSSAFLTAYERINPVGTLLALMGYLLLLAAMAVALLAGSHLSSLVAAGLPNPEINQDLTKFFGDATWPQTVDQVGMIVAGLILFVSLILVTVGRRKAGGAHIIRAVLGMSLLFWAMSSIPHWLPEQADQGVVALFETGKVGPAITALLGKIDGSTVQTAAVITIAAIFLLVWPAKRRTVSYQPLQPVEGVN